MQERVLPLYPPAHLGCWKSLPLTWAAGDPSGGSTVSTYMAMSSHKPMCHAACALIMAISRLR